MRGIAAFLIFAAAVIAQAEDVEPVDIGPFATEGWVEEKLESFEAITNGFASTDWVENKQYVTEQVTNGLASTKWVENRQYVTEDVTNGLAGSDWVVGLQWDWYSVTNKPAIVYKETDPAFTNWLATTNSATVWYVDEHKWDWSTQITNAPSFAQESIRLSPYYSAFTLRYESNGSRTFYYDGTNYTVGLFMVDSKGDPYISACNGQYARYMHPVFFNSKYDAFEDINGNDVRIYTSAFDPDYFSDGSDRSLWFKTNNVLKAGTVATVEDLAGLANKSYVDEHKWDWKTQVTNAPSFVTVDAMDGYVATNHRGKVRIYAPGSLTIGNSMDYVYANSSASLALGANSIVENAYGGMALGIYAHTTNQFAFVYGGNFMPSKYYGDHGAGTFNVNPNGGLSGFWIGDKNLKTHFESIDNVFYDRTYIDGPESAYQSLKHYDLLDTFVGSRRANRYVSLYGSLYIGEKADLVSTALDPNPGGFTLSVGRGNTEAKGRSSVALGNNVTTADDDSFVTGYGGKVTGKIGFASGKNTRAKGNVSTATGEGTTAAGYASSSSGWFTLASAGTSQAHGKYVWAKDSDSWAWSAGFDSNNASRASLWTSAHADNIQNLTEGFYASHGPGTFNVDPLGGTEGFWIGETNLATYLQTAGGGDHTHSNLVNGTTEIVANANGTGSIVRQTYTTEERWVSISFSDDFDAYWQGPEYEVHIYKDVAANQIVYVERDKTVRHDLPLSLRRATPEEQEQGISWIQVGYSADQMMDCWFYAGGYASGLMSPNTGVSFPLATDEYSNASSGTGYRFDRGTGSIWGGYNEEVQVPSGTISETIATEQHVAAEVNLSLDAIAPAFSASKVYANGDCVIYEQHLYECTNYTGTAGWRAGDWKQTTVTEILGDLRRVLDTMQ